MTEELPDLYHLGKAHKPEPKRSTHHVLIIWPHGVRYTEQITFDLISQRPWLKPLGMWYRVIQQDRWEKYVRDVYAASPVPAEHLVAKTEYLRRQPGGKVIVYLVEDTDPQEEWVGEGAFRQMQDMRLQAWKQRERDRWNPRGPDGKRSENHVIHGTDADGEADRLLALHGIQPVEYFHRYDKSPIICSPYVDLSSWSVQEDVELGRLLVGQLRSDGNNEMVPIADSHIGRYAAATQPGVPLRDVVSTCDAIWRYWRLHAGRRLCELGTHYPTIYDEMLRSWRPDTTDKNLILLERKKVGLYVLDGAHRACTMLFTYGIRRYRCAIVIQTA